MDGNIVKFLPAFLLANIIIFLIAVVLVFYYSKILLRTNRQELEKIFENQTKPQLKGILRDTENSSVELRGLAQRLRIVESRLDVAMDRLGEADETLKRLPSIVASQFARLNENERARPPEDDSDRRHEQQAASRQSVLQSALSQWHPEDKRLLVLASLVTRIVDVSDSESQRELQPCYSRFVEADRMLRKLQDAPLGPRYEILSHLADRLKDLKSENFVNAFVPLLDASRHNDQAQSDRMALMKHFGIDEVSFEVGKVLPDLSRVTVSKDGLLGEGEAYVVEETIRPGYRDIGSDQFIRKPEVRLRLRPTRD